MNQKTDLDLEMMPFQESSTNSEVTTGPAPSDKTLSSEMEFRTQQSELTTMTTTGQDLVVVSDVVMSTKHQLDPASTGKETLTRGRLATIRRPQANTENKKKKKKKKKPKDKNHKIAQKP